MHSTADFALITHRQAQKTAIATMIAALALVAICFVTIHAGAIHIPPGTATRLIAQQLGLAPVDDSMQALRTILIEIRLPRIALGVLTGAGLAVAGVTLQGLFRNPLADPGLVGVSTGAATAAAAFIVLGWPLFEYLSAPVLRHALPIAAFVGGLLTTIAIYAVATREGRTDVATLLLAGVAINAMAAACIGLLVFLSSENELRDLNFWMLGSLNGVTWDRLVFVGPLILAATIALARFARHLNALLLGEIEARHLGFDVERTKRWMITLVALDVGAIVAMTGAIGFVGLLVPHLVRLMMGADHRTLYPLSALLGACLVLLADLFARTIVVPAELPIGIITSFLGGPFFLWLLLRQKAQGAF
ncbi:FecCD family ABC transporter permease [Dongia deserti]|uniref:FecCD family ABC transporter permease n=1 Tax=Dongia deserti TaxID=2268030 RepID=UPI000E64BBDD|nr:iron ABC transporter permease [Dongia deserti]